MAVDELAREAGGSAWESRCRSHVIAVSIAGEPAVLAKPLTFMNASGGAVRLLLEEYGVDPKGMIVLLDDLNLPFGRIRIRARGSPGGHRGLESIARALESDEITRVRLGIGEEFMPADKAAFVLSDFPRDRRTELVEMIGRAAQAVRMMIGDGVTRAMSVFNA